MSNNIQGSWFKASRGGDGCLPRISAGLLLAIAVSGCDQGASSESSATQVSATPAGAVTEVALAEAAPAVAAALPELSEFAQVWGPPLASDAPVIAAADHTGTPQTLGSLSGERGLLLVFSRSADW